MQPEIMPIRKRKMERSAAHGPQHGRVAKKNATVGFLGVAALTMAAFPLAWAQTAKPRPLPPGAYAKNVEFVSFTEVGGHIPFKMSIQQANGHWYMYVGAQYDRGWGVLDITNPADPTILNWIPGPKNTRTVQVDIADGKMITGLERPQGGGDTDPKKPWDDGVLIWSLAEPAHPSLLGEYHTGGLGTHRRRLPRAGKTCTRRGRTGYSGNIFEAVDISDPRIPVEVSRWALPESEARGSECAEYGVASRPRPTWTARDRREPRVSWFRQ